MRVEKQKVFLPGRDANASSKRQPLSQGTKNQAEKVGKAEETAYASVCSGQGVAFLQNAIQDPEELPQQSPREGHDLT